MKIQSPKKTFNILKTNLKFEFKNSNSFRSKKMNMRKKFLNKQKK